MKKPIGSTSRPSVNLPSQNRHVEEVMLLHQFCLSPNLDAEWDE